MTKRAYGQYCGLARAVEIVGERWALLIIRDLLVSPKRFTDLRKGLPRIPSNILSDRLKELEQAGLVARRILPRPATGVVYELTEHGLDLEDAVLALGRWGARCLGDPRPGEIITVDSMTMAFRTIFQPEAAAGLRVDYELRMGDLILNLLVDDGQLTVNERGLSEPDLIIEAGPAIKTLLAREVTPVEAIAAGSVRLTGDPQFLDRFVEVFRI